MNNNMMIMVSTTNTPPTSSDLQLCPVSPDGYDSFRPTLDTFDVSAGNVQAITTIRPHHLNPRRKRTKMNRFHKIKPIVGVNVASCSHSGVITKKKSDPSAPKITRPCTECGKRFWSWKALFGHMRCHPERPWRGINPPPNLHHPPLEDLTRVTTEEDQYVAACLLMLANTPTENIPHHHPHQSGLGFNETLAIQITDPETRFECSSCKKVFGSHQALGGHRASHKNVKGCFAITRNEEIEDGEFVSNYDRNVNVVEVSGQHKCSICFKIFSSGQALGGHKRRHWEKDDSVVPTASTSVLSQPFRFDLNLPPPPPPPPPPQDDSTCSSSDLDLRLGV